MYKHIPIQSTHLIYNSFLTKGLFLLFSISISISAIAQNQRINALEITLQNISSGTSYESDTSKCRILNSLAYELRNIDSNKSYDYSLQALALAGKYDFKNEMIISYRMAGIYYLKKGKYSEALQNLEKGLSIAVQTNNQIELGRIFANIGIAYYNQGNFSKALEYYEEGLRIAEMQLDKPSIANILSNMGIIYRSQSNLPKALDYYKKSLDIRIEIGDQLGVANSLNNIGIIQKEQGRFSEAVSYYQESLKILEIIGDQQNKANTFKNIGVVYSDQANYPLALQYYQRSLEIREKIDDPQGIASSLNGIGEIYHKKADYIQALECYKKALAINERIGNQMGIANTLNNMAETYIKLEKYEEALPVLLQSQQINESIGNKVFLTYNLNAIALLYQKQAKYEQSNEYALRSLSIAKEINTPIEIRNAYEILYQTAKIQKDYTKALGYFENYKIVNDSLFNLEKSKAIANLENQAEIVKKEKEISLLAKDKELGQILTESQNRKLAILTKQSEADRFLAMARQEKDKRKADSLYNLAQKSQLETEKLRIQDEKISAENKIKSVLIEQSIQTTSLQQRIIYLIVTLLISVLALAYFIYRNLLRAKKAKEIAFIQKNEIEALNNNLENLVEERTQTLEERTEILEMRNKQLEDYAFFNSHKLRQPLANLLGLYELIKTETNEEQRDILFEYFDESLKKLDQLVYEIQQIVEEKDTKRLEEEAFLHQRIPSTPSHRN